MGKGALREVQEHARAARVVIESHAFERMDEFDVAKSDVMCALENAGSCRAQPNGRWKVIGPDRDGDSLVVIVEAAPQGLSVVTVNPDV